jgi:hypothetical protein
MSDDLSKYRVEQAHYQRRDPRMRCLLCGRWMRYHPTDKSPATRRPPPNAARCTDCMEPCRHCGARDRQEHRSFCIGAYRGKIYAAPDR